MERENQKSDALKRKDEMEAVVLRKTRTISEVDKLEE